MANTKLNILQQPRQLLLIVSIVIAAFVFLHAPAAHAAACSPPLDSNSQPKFGSVTSSVNIPVNATGTYVIWSRMTNGTSTTAPIDNSYMLQIDGTTCYTVGGASTALPTSFNPDSSNWVNYQNGVTGTPITFTFSTSGSHSIVMYGNADGVKLDRIGFLQQGGACSTNGSTPTGTGDNCFPPIDSTNPTVSISSPAAGAKLRGTATVNVTAADDSGTVSKVELYVDGGSTPVATVTTGTSPFSLSWDTTTATAGTHSLTAKAYDPTGNSAVSAAVSVTVDNVAPTSVAITPPPANGATLTGTVTLNATASDNIGVASVNFYSGTTLLSSDTTSPYSYNWNTSGVADGPYALTVKAFDAAGNVTTSSVVNVTVSNSGSGGDTIPPTTSVSIPATGATLLFGNNNVTASAADNVGVVQVELYVDGTKVATDVAAPYNFVLSTLNLANGSHTLFTKAYDAATLTGNSTTVNFTIDNHYTNPGDCTGDGHVTIIDLSRAISNYGVAGFKDRTQCDLDNNGTVNLLDLSSVLTYYGS